MAEINPPFVLQSGNTAEAFRGLVKALVSVPGVQAATDMAVTQTGTPSMGVSVAAGAVYVAGTLAATQGTYRCINDAATVKTVAASDPTNPRIDLVCAVVADSYYSGGTNAWSLTVVTGVPSGSPAVPATPANGYVLARVAVAAAASSIVNANITDFRTIAYPALGPRGVLPGGYAQATANQAIAAGTPTDLTNLTATVNVGTGRRIRITGYVPFDTNTLDAGVSVFIKEGATQLQLAGARGSPSIEQAVSPTVVLTPAAGAHTYKLSLTMTTAGNSAPSATNPSYILVEDIGPAVP